MTEQLKLKHTWQLTTGFCKLSMQWQIIKTDCSFMAEIMHGPYGRGCFDQVRAMHE